MYKRQDKYCRDLTRRAAERELDPVFCREAELDRMVELLCRRQKNNPCLVGEPGVGKTALAEGLAQRIATDVYKRQVQGQEHHVQLRRSVHPGAAAESKADRGFLYLHR